MAEQAVNISHIKKSISFRVDRVPDVPEVRRIFQIDVQEFGVGNQRRARVTVKGLAYGDVVRTRNFTLYGYRYSAGMPPEWLVKLIREVGYEGPIEEPIDD